MVLNCNTYCNKYLQKKNRFKFFREMKGSYAVGRNSGNLEIWESREFTPFPGIPSGERDHQSSL